VSKKDYYKILGVPEGTNMDEIKKSYRKLAMQYHPDRNPENRENAEKRFKDISEAFYVLGDEKRRAEYDAYKKGYGFGAGGTFTGAQGFDFEEILKHFGGRGRSSGGFGGVDDIFNIFSHMGDNVQTEYIYRGPGGSRVYTNRTQEEQADFNATLAIPPNIAQMGGEVLFKHNGKKITLRIKPGTKSGQKLRIKGQGKICTSCGHPGDLIVTININ